MSQCSRIYGHLLSGKPITRLQAIQKFGCLNLWSRIGELERQAGVKIKREWAEVKNRYGKKCRVMRYRMV